MAKWVKVVLVLSLVLNLGLVVGFGFYRSYVRNQSFKLAALTTESDAQFKQYVLSELESGDPARIESLKQRLHKIVEQGPKIVEVWREAAAGK
jgi:hypothetical protein